MWPWNDWLSLELRLETNQNFKKWLSQINIFLIKYRCEILYMYLKRIVYISVLHVWWHHDDFNPMQFISVIQIYPPDDFFFFKGRGRFWGFWCLFVFYFWRGLFFFSRWITLLKTFLPNIYILRCESECACITQCA